jgi:ribosomal protein S12 methylthiotransferase accessory factor
VPTEDAYYRVVPGVDAVHLADGNVLLHSGTLTLRLEGDSAVFLATDVLPLLDGTRPLAEVARVARVDAADLCAHLDSLVDRGILRRAERPLDPRELSDDLGPFLALLDELGLAQSEAHERLAALSIVVVGLEAHGAHLAWNLARVGVGKLVLVDPYPLEPGNLPLVPEADPGVIGTPRQEVLRRAMPTARGTQTSTLDATEVTRKSIRAVASGADVIVGCFDKAFSATNIWINETALELGVIGLFGQVHAHIATLGPLVLPGRSACYLCWRMRALACADNFDEAMAYEEFLDRRLRGSLHTRSVLPFLPEYAGSVLATQSLIAALGLSVPPLVNTVLEFNGLTLTSETHAVLQKPDCPACKKKRTRLQPALEALATENEARGDVLAARSKLVSRRCGVIKAFHEVPRDVTEPAAPFVYRAELANHRFVDDAGDELVASGKGMTRGVAAASAIGEAVERYSSSCWDESDLVLARRWDIDGESLDPRALVLYRPEQYEFVGYAPYSDEAALGWVPARSLGTSHEVLVPALAVSLAYQVRSPEEYLFGPSSNGLAAGSTLVAAIVSGALEVIERDAFLIAWFNQLPCAAADPSTHPDAAFRRLYHAYRRRGVALSLHRLPSDHPVHVFLALAIDAAAADGPAAVVGLGADLDAARAAMKAALEVGQVRPALRLRLREPETRSRLEELVAEPHAVSTLQDHDLLYASNALLDAFSFLRANPLSPFEWPDPGESAAEIEELACIVEFLRSAGHDILYVNVSSPDMAALGLHTVRVLIPGFQPIDFGWNERRLGGDRMFDIPYRLGVTAAPTTPALLNPLPHPLA